MRSELSLSLSPFLSLPLPSSPSRFLYHSPIHRRFSFRRSLAEERTQKEAGETQRPNRPSTPAAMPCTLTAPHAAGRFVRCAATAAALFRPERKTRQKVAERKRGKESAGRSCDDGKRCRVSTHTHTRTHTCTQRHHSDTAPLSAAHAHEKTRRDRLDSFSIALRSRSRTADGRALCRQHRRKHTHTHTHTHTLNAAPPTSPLLQPVSAGGRGAQCWQRRGHSPRRWRRRRRC